MLEFDLPAMSCGHCAATVTEACHEVDPDARVEVNLDTKHVKIETSQERAGFARALTEAGYPPAP